jgi:hypothetical protein
MKKTGYKQIVLTVLFVIGAIALLVLSYRGATSDDIIKSVVSIIAIFFLKEFTKKGRDETKRLK